ncbi:MAG: hypothetical protein KDA91_14560 [Planctomycetaceae bacterium]|nr:hypothetical protein [Planctomycetaceae bacterium]
MTAFETCSPFRMTTSSSQQRPETSPQTFPGFEPLTANYVYCPNQFLDVCLPNCSRGAVRIVGYLLRETLGWLDSNGRPLKQQITVRYRDLIQKAGVSRGAIGPALAEAVQAGFIQCSQTASQKLAGQSGQSAVYSLRWASTGDYITNIHHFAGFFTGEGHRTPVPNRFFDDVIPRESLSVVKVVGAVIRHTVGYQNQFGGRRTSAPLSYSQIQRYSNLNDRSTLAQALRHAQQTGYIECVHAGRFSANTEQQQAATYAIRWLQHAKTSVVGSKNQPEAEQFKNPTSIGSESPPEDRFKKPTSKKDNSTNDIHKQQHAAVTQAVSLLVNSGLDRATAIKLAEKRGLAVVENQLAWLDSRNPTTNRIGMLRKAVDEDWPKPAAVADREKRSQDRLKHRRQNQQRLQEESVNAAEKQKRRQRRQRLLDEWGSSSFAQRQRWIQLAAKRENSARIRDIIRRDSPSTTKPHMQVLDVVALELNLPMVMRSSQTDTQKRSDTEVAADETETANDTFAAPMSQQNVTPQGREGLPIRSRISRLTSIRVEMKPAVANLRSSATPNAT